MLACLHEEVQKLLKETDNAIQQLTEGLHAMGRHLEAALREVRIDTEGLDGKRKRDKMGLEEDIASVTKQVGHHTQAAERALLRADVGGMDGGGRAGWRFLFFVGVGWLAGRAAPAFWLCLVLSASWPSWGCGLGRRGLRGWIPPLVGS